MSAPETGPKRIVFYPFEGEQLSVNQVHARVPVLSAVTVRRYLQRGISTVHGMLSVKRQTARNGRGKPVKLNGGRV